jgi:hypothetical protein
MQMLTNKKPPLYDASTAFMVLFFKPAKQLSFLDFLFSKLVQLYTRGFGFDSCITHCAVVLGTTLYEVSLGGCTKAEFSPTTLLHEDLVAIYTIGGLTETEEQKLKYEAACFMLEQDAASNRKLDMGASFLYLLFFMWWRLRLPLDELHDAFNDFSLKPGTIKKTKKEEGGCLKFNLPFTCSTQASNTIQKLFELDHMIDAHVPAALWFYLNLLTKFGFGSMIVFEKQRTKNK